MNREVHFAGRRPSQTVAGSRRKVSSSSFDVDDKTAVTHYSRVRTTYTQVYSGSKIVHTAKLQNGER